MTTFEEAFAMLRAESPDRDVILVSQAIGRGLHRVLSWRIRNMQSRSKVTLFLTTYGGDPHAGFRIARCLQHHYGHVRVVVPSYCKSAGTLIAVSAHELAIGDLGELGPLDLQFTKPSEVLERESGLDYMQGLNVALAHAQTAFTTFLEVRRGGMRLPTSQAGELASKIACGIVAPLYSQIDPNRIGEMQRAIRIAQEYGTRLNEVGKNLKDDALERLVAEYSSHSFVIDRKEARTLFKTVDRMSQAEVKLAESVWDFLGDQGEFVHFCDDPAPTTQPASDDGPEPELTSIDAQPGFAVSEPDATAVGADTDGSRSGPLS